MTSGGGATTLEIGAAEPVRLVESGPAGGAILVAHASRSSAASSARCPSTWAARPRRSASSTTTSRRLSRSFEFGRVWRFFKGSGLPMRIPVIEMVEIGAGGGSIARIDDMQRVQVGPDSAGSEPGPACYGRGGKRCRPSPMPICVMGYFDAQRLQAGACSSMPACATRNGRRSREAAGIDDALAALADQRNRDREHG